MKTVRKQFGNVIRIRADSDDTDEQATRCDDVGTLWPNWKDCRATARRAIAATRKEGRPLLNHNGMWYERTASTHYRLLSERDLKKKLYDMLEHARYATGDDKSAPWLPNPNRIKGVVEAAYGLADAGVDPPGWLDGRDEPVIPCQNGLLRVADRKLLRHSADYFNVYVLPFEYNRRAECPRWKQFLDEVFPGDKRSQAPQVKRKARQRLDEAADMLARELLSLASSAESEAVQLGAIRDALDRVGLTGKSTVEVEHTLKPYERLLANMRGVARGISRDESRARRGLPAIERPADEPIDAEVVDDPEDGADLAADERTPRKRPSPRPDRAPLPAEPQYYTGMDAIEEAARVNRAAGVYGKRKRRRR